MGVILWLVNFFSSVYFSYFILLVALIYLLWLLFRLLVILREKMIGRIIYSREFSEVGVHAGDSVVLTEIICNPTIFPLFHVDVGCYISIGLEIDGSTAEKEDKLQYFTSRFFLPPFSKITRTHNVKCYVRNHYLLNSVEIFCNKKFINIPSYAELFVYPQPFNDKNRVLPQLNLMGNEMAKNRYIKDPFMVAGLRNYLPGDSFSSINFKASARSIRGGIRELVVNNNDFSSQLNIMIYMDFDVPRFLKIETDAYENAIETGLSFCAEIICEAALQGGKVGFAANARGYDGSLSMHYQPFAGITNMVEIFKSMSALTPMTGMSFAALLDRDIGKALYDTDICILTFHANPEIDIRLNQFRRFGRGVTVITL